MGAAGTIPTKADDVLNSWKEIAAYLQRGVRTVQRWEADLKLPVRRPRGKERSPVLAMRSDIDDWLRACPVIKVSRANGHSAAPPRECDTSLRSVLLESRKLRYESRRLGIELHDVVSSMIENVRKTSTRLVPPEVFRVNGKH